MLYGPIWPNLADINKVFHILHSVHYNLITIIQTNKCMQLYEIYINITKTTNSYTLWALLAHHEKVQLLQKTIS